MFTAVRPLLSRLNAIDAEIRKGKGPNASTLSRALEVSRRTVPRDIDFLRDRLLAPLFFDPKKNGYFYSDASWTLPYFKLAEGELVALFVAQQVMRQYGQHPYAAELRTAFTKLCTLLPDTVNVDFSALADALTVQPIPSQAIDLDLFRTLHRAVRNRQRIDILYWTASTQKERHRTVDPYGLANLDGDWYLIGFCHARCRVLMFAVSRVRELEELPTTFDKPQDFSMNTYLSDAFRRMRGHGPSMRVRLHFAPATAIYVREKTFHPTQHLDPQLDGSLILTMRVSHLLEVKPWVLSFGANCEVLAPKRLREQIQEEVRRMIEKLGEGERE